MQSLFWRLSLSAASVQQHQLVCSRRGYRRAWSVDRGIGRFLPTSSNRHPYLGCNLRSAARAQSCTRKLHRKPLSRPLCDHSDCHRVFAAARDADPAMGEVWTSPCVPCRYSCTRCCLDNFCDRQHSRDRTLVVRRSKALAMGSAEES